MRRPGASLAEDGSGTPGPTFRTQATTAVVFAP
jgi:hypothetical protein